VTDEDAASDRVVSALVVGCIARRCLSRRHFTRARRCELLRRVRLSRTCPTRFNSCMSCGLLAAAPPPAPAPACGCARPPTPRSCCSACRCSARQSCSCQPPAAAAAASKTPAFVTPARRYLMDNDTSWMVLFSSGSGLLIELWKMTKARQRH
jgi:hypothetical protein